jgi:hypothetical protein
LQLHGASPTEQRTQSIYDTSSLAGETKRQPAAAGAAPEAADNDAAQDDENLANIVFSGWAAMVLVSIGVVYVAKVLFSIYNAEGYPWPFPRHGKDSAACANEALAARFDPVFEAAIATAPTWLRGLLTSAAVASMLAWLTGFRASRYERRHGRGLIEAADAVGDAQLPGDARISAQGELLTALLARESTSGHAAEVAAALAEERRLLHEWYERDLNLVKARSVGGLLRMLLTGSALKPAPRVDAGYLAVADDATRQVTWHQARESLGLNTRQAVAVSITKLVLWHWSQPIAYLFVFRVYFCELDNEQVIFGLVVAAREVLYLATTLAAAVACPAYLLVDIRTTWMEACSTKAACGRVAMYILTPHNYVVLCLATHFSERGAPHQPDETGSSQEDGGLLHYFRICSCGLLAVFSMAAFQTNGFEERPVRGASIAVIYSVLIIAGLWVAVRRNARLWAALRSWENNINTTKAFRNAMLLSSPTSVSMRQEREHRHQKERQLREAKGLLARAFHGIMGMQILADFSSCFALGLLDRHERQVAGSDTPSLVALRWGYGITAAEFVFLFGPATVVTLYSRAWAATERHNEEAETPLASPGGTRGWVGHDPVGHDGVGHSVLIQPVERLHQRCRLFMCIGLFLVFLLLIGMMMVAVTGDTYAVAGPFLYLLFWFGVVLLFWFGVSVYGAVYRTHRQHAKGFRRIGAAATWALATTAGTSVLAGLVYVLLGAALLASGEDIYCTAYTFESRAVRDAQCAQLAGTFDCVAGGCGCSASCTAEQREALLRFKGASTALPTWTKDSQPCGDHWHGVTCSTAGAIIRLDLNGTAGVSGNIAPLGGLKALVHLDLSGTGAIGWPLVANPCCAFVGIANHSCADGSIACHGADGGQ